jgi:magnesium transporter
MLCNGQLWAADEGIPNMIIDCAHYQDGRRDDQGPVPLQEALARAAQGGFVWLGLFEPEEEELDEVRDVFGLHKLAVEDALNVHMRPKIEYYEQDMRLVVLRTARYDDAAEEVEFGQISVFLAPSFVITVRQGVASELREARQRLEQHPDLLAAGSASALWAILDQVVDGYAPVVAGLERDIDQIEATVFSGAAAPTERIYSLRREATEFYRAVHPLLAVTGTAERMVDKKLRHYLRDVRDHLLQTDEEVAAQRDLLGTILEANMAVISVEQTKISIQQNSTIEQLTILATIFLPLTFVTGFFGQNFGWLVRHIDGGPAFVAFGIGGLVVPLALLFSWLRLRARKTRRALPDCPDASRAQPWGFGKHRNRPARSPPWPRCLPAPTLGEGRGCP